METKRELVGNNKIYMDVADDQYRARDTPCAKCKQYEQSVDAIDPDLYCPDCALFYDVYDKPYYVNVGTFAEQRHTKQAPRSRRLRARRDANHVGSGRDAP